MLYDTPEGATTPFIPPLPSPESAVQPPLIPTPDDRGPPPGWAQQPRTPMHYPYYPSTPYNTTPFIPPMPSMQGTPAMRAPDPPGSYYPAPSALPNAYGAPPGPGFSADFTGYPTLNGTPWAAPASMPPPSAMPPGPWPGQPQATGYNAFQTPLPPGGPGWGPPMGAFTPAAAAWGMGMHPGMFPGMHPGMTPNAFGAGHTPWQHPTQPPPPAAAPPNDTARAAFRWTTSADRMDPFTEGPNYGPVLEPFLVKVVGANVKLNPLLSPPSDTEEDYLRWNMLFHTSNCYRTSESRRSWVKGRKAPATHPRLTHVRIVSRTFPWMIHARARDPKIGVTCGEVLDAISAYLHGDVAKKEYEHMPQARKRFIWSSYQHNRSTDPNVPGGGLGEALKRLDWLGQDSRFGGLVVNSDFVKEHCGDILPCTFELKCVSGRTMAQQGSREQPSRQHHSSRRRSSSRPRSLGGSAEEEEEEE